MLVVTSFAESFCVLIRSSAFEPARLILPGGLPWVCITKREKAESEESLEALDLANVIRMRERWVLLKIPRCDIDGVGKVK